MAPVPYTKSPAVRMCATCTLVLLTRYLYVKSHPNRKCSSDATDFFSFSIMQGYSPVMTHLVEFEIKTKKNRLIKKFLLLLDGTAPTALHRRLRGAFLRAPKITNERIKHDNLPFFLLKDSQM